MHFSHLHVHTQFSLLDGAADIKKMLAKAAENDMKAMAITDHGNMFGVFKFVSEAAKKGIKPIVGCEFYVVQDRHKKNFTKESGDKRFHQLLLAKNKTGYENLCKLCSLGYIEGMYSKWPRIDHELIEKYHQGLIATTCCIGAEIPQAILNEGEEKAELLFKWYLDLFGEDYYVELQRHNLPDQEIVNQVLLKFAKKYNVKIIATNDSHYVNQEDYVAHDILLCINTNEKRSTPIGDGKGFRFGFENDQFYFKTRDEMLSIFSDIPEALDNTQEIVDKVDTLNLKKELLMPEFPIPTGFENADDYLRALTYDGAKKRYKEITAEVAERLETELNVIISMKFSSYFLIVADFIKAGREMGVLVGPGRGSAAGSAVAYAIGITNIDPIKYNLLFERFLNPERVSMPDIDTDFDDAGRQRVIDYVVDKYTKNRVAQIVTYGSMAAKMSIKDVARVLDLNLQEASALADLVPSKPGTTLSSAYNESEALRMFRNSDDLKGEVLRNAEVLEGSVRNTGVHAAGIIISGKDLIDHIPLAVSRDSVLYVTQYDGKVIEEAGMLKMDFLGLKTLTIIQKAVNLIKRKHGITIDPDEIPLDDEKTLNLYKKGDTIGTFQFESESMRKFLKELEPGSIEDLIAMNALYRPGPLKFIDVFIRRRHGKEAVDYPHPLLEPILKPSYGIMVYQEQIMQAAQAIAGYSLGGADLLRRAMGKKDKEKMAKEREKFVEGAGRLHDIPEAKANEIFDIMERFAEYGFNRSHSAAYSIVAFQTAYLKAHYPAEYMASLLNSYNNMDDIKVFMEESRRMGIRILGPCINESESEFSVNPRGEIRYGLGALKGVGEVAVAEIVAEREKNGPFKSAFDLVSRVNSKAVNKRSLESLVLSGSFDSFHGTHRAQYMYQEGHEIFLDKIIRFGNTMRDNKNSNQVSLFDDMSQGDVSIPPPALPACQEWSTLEKLRKEKDIIGMFLTGHPLDTYAFELKHYCNATISEINAMTKEAKETTNLCFAGIVSDYSVYVTRKGDPAVKFTIEDYNASYTFNLFRDEATNCQRFLQDGAFLYLQAKFRRRYNTEEYELIPQQVNFLSEVSEKLTRELSCWIPHEALTSDLCHSLIKVVKQNAGKIKLRLVFLSKDENLETFLESRNPGISMTTEVIDFFGKLEFPFKVQPVHKVHPN